MSKAVCHFVEEFWLKDRAAEKAPAVYVNTILLFYILFGNTFFYPERLTL